jgi:hypothetical protein
MVELIVVVEAPRSSHCPRPASPTVHGSHRQGHHRFLWQTSSLLLEADIEEDGTSKLNSWDERFSKLRRDYKATIFFGIGKSPEHEYCYYVFLFEQDTVFVGFH